MVGEVIISLENNLLFSYSISFLRILRFREEYTFKLRLTTKDEPCL